MIRAVLDTNVVVSALILRGVTAPIADFWQAKAFVPVVSKAIAQEYLKVLAYPKFQLTIEEIRSLVEYGLLRFAEPVEVSRVPQVIAEDPSDDIFLACAWAGKCDYLVSGDQIGRAHV